MATEKVKRTSSKAAPKLDGWGKENYPYPNGAAYIECDEMK